MRVGHLRTAGWARRGAAAAPARSPEHPSPHLALRDNLPTPISSFLGRQRELEEVARLLEGHRALTLTGSGGVGKTRLALEVATTLRGRFADGAWWVELAPLQDAAVVPQAAAAALGVLEAPGVPLAEHLALVLRPRELLLVLDNCEHLLDACAALAERLLRGCPGLRLLATSREPLGIGGEAVWRVPSLSLPDAQPSWTLEQVATSEAARLFVERAGAVRADFRLLPETADGVARVCRELDGIPLALELAAARLAALTVEQLAARLSDRFRLLTGGSPTAPTRQQTLRGALDWSHELLTEPERALLRRLGVFAGGWTLEAAEAVAAGDGIEAPRVLDLLAGLVNKSLARLDERDGEARYGMLETVRQYAREKLAASGEAEAVAGRHSAYYLALAERAEPELAGPGQAEWLERLEREHDNLRAALGRAVSGGAGEPGVRLGAVLWRFWMSRGYLGEGLRWLESALSSASPVPEAVRAEALYGAGTLAWLRGEYARSLELHQAGLQVRQALGEPLGLSRAFLGLGNAVSGQPDVPAARGFYEESLRLARLAGDAWGIATALNNLGSLRFLAPDRAAARPLFEESLALLRQLGDRAQAIHPLNNLSQLAREAGDHERAGRLALEALGLSREQGDLRGVAECLETLAGLAVTRQAPERAARLFGAAEAVREVIGAPLQPDERIDHDRDVAAARRLLGAAAFAAAWAAGRILSPEEAAAEALVGGPASRSAELPRHPPTSTDAGPLTPREVEVAALVARGFSNRQVAEALVIAEGTAANHVKHILGKLDYSSRAQVAAWAVAHGLLPTPPAEP